MEITKVVKPFIRRGWPNTFGNIVYITLVIHTILSLYYNFILLNITYHFYYVNYIIVFIISA